MSDANAGVMEKAGVGKEAEGVTLAAVICKITVIVSKERNT